VLALSARGDANDLAAKIEAGNGTPDDLAEHNRLADKAGDRATVSRILFGSAAAVAVTGVLLYYLDSPRVESQPVVTPTVTADSVGAVYTRSF
jgi:hypothetical protein